MTNLTAMKHFKFPDMFEGPILPTALKIGMPILIGNLIQLLYMGVDTYFISMIDKHSTALLSGTGLLFPLFFLFMAIGTSLSIGISAITGRAIGEKNHEAARYIFASGFLIAAIIGLTALIVGYLFKQPFVDALAGKELSMDAILYGLDYFAFLLPGLAMMLFAHVFSGILQGEGLTGEIAKAMLLSTILNIILDPIFIFGFEMGVAGAGLATSISTFSIVVYLSFRMISRKTLTPISFNITLAKVTIIKEIFYTGFPQFLNMSTIAVAIMILNKMVGNISENSMNAWTIVGRMDQLLIIPAIAVGGATITMISQNFGKNNLERVRTIYKTNVMLAIVMVAIAAMVYNALATLFFPAFSSVPEVIEAAIFQVRCTSFTFVGLGVAITSGSTFQATAKPYPSIVIPVFRMGIITIPLAYLMVNMLDMKMNGLYLALAIGNLSAIPVAYLWTQRHLNNIKFKAIGK